MDDSLRKQIDNIASVEDYLRYKEHLDKLDHQEQSIDAPPLKPIPVSKPRVSILKQSKYDQPKESRVSLGPKESRVSVGPKESRVSVGATMVDQTMNYPLYQTMAQDHSKFEISRVYRKEEQYQEYLKESRRYGEGVQSREEYIDQPVRQAMQHSTDRALHHLLSDVDSLIKRAVGTQSKQQHQYTDTLINNHLLPTPSLLPSSRPDKKPSYLSNQDVRTYLSTLSINDPPQPVHPPPQQITLPQPPPEHPLFQSPVFPQQTPKQRPSPPKQVTFQKPSQQQSPQGMAAVQPNLQSSIHEQIMKRANAHNERVLHMRQNMDQSQQHMQYYQQPIVQPIVQQQMEQPVAQYPPMEVQVISPNGITQSPLKQSCRRALPSELELEIYDESMDEKSGTMYQLDYQDNLFIQKYQIKITGLQYELGTMLNKMGYREEESFRKHMAELSGRLEYRLDQSQALSEQIMNEGNDDLRLDLINNRISQVLHKMTIRQKRLEEIWYDGCQDRLLLLGLFYLGVLLEAGHRVMMQNQCLADLMALSQDLETVKQKLVNLSPFVFAYVLNLLQVALQYSALKMGLIQTILDKLELCTQKTPLDHTTIVVKNPPDFEFDVN